MRQRALVALGGGYSNIVMATPVIAALDEMGYRVDALVESDCRDAATLLSGWSLLDSIYLTRAGLRRVECGRGYDAVLRTVHNQKAGLQLGPELRPEPVPAEFIHESAANLSALRPLGWSGRPPAFHVECDEPVTPMPPFAAIAPGYTTARRDNAIQKSWPHWERFCDLFHAQSGLDVIALGVEEDSAPWMSDPSRPWLRSLCGMTSIRRAAGIIARCEWLFALDSALAHIGAALGKPVVALFGPTSEAQASPLGPRAKTVAEDIPCRPCRHAAGWLACADRRCMRDLSPETVLSAAMPEVTTLAV